MTRSLFLLSNRFSDLAGWSAATPEMLELGARAGSKAVRVVPVGPDAIAIAAPSGGPLRVFLAGELADPNDGLMVRSISGAHYEFGRLATLVMETQRSFCVDPVARFAGGSGSKTSTTVERSLSGAGSDSVIVARRSNAVDIAELLLILEQLELTFPVLVKPSGGKQGLGVEVAQDVTHLQSLLDRVLKYDDFLIQRFESFQNEYRVLMFRGKSLGVVRKLASRGSVAANAAQGAAFTAVSDNQRNLVSQIALSLYKGDGLVGLDLGETRDGEFRLIEANHAPQWSAFTAASGVDVATLIIDAFLTDTQR